MSGGKYSKKHGARAVGSVLGSRTGQIGELITQARAMASLEQKLIHLLDPGMADMVRVATVRDGCLVLVTPSAALATRLKMDQQSIIRSLNASAGLRLVGLQIRTAPIPRQRKAIRKRRSVPDAAKEVLSRFKD